MKKLKVVLICHFSNPMVRSHLPLDSRKLYNAIRRCMGLPSKQVGYGDIASWDTNFIDNFKYRDDVDLTVISAHSGLKKSVVHFEAENVKYYFVRCDRATLLKHLIKSPVLWHRLNPMRPVVRKIVHKIHPDVVALMGAENAYYSGTVLGLENEYPVIFKAQTIYNNPNRSNYGLVDAKNSYVEKLIFEKLRYASVTAQMHYELYRFFQKESFNFPWSFGTSFVEVKPEIKKYDFVCFAMKMTPAKGFSDAIQALGIVAKSHPEVRMNLIGEILPEHQKIYNGLISENHLEKNIEFTSFFERQKDLFQHLQKSRFAVLPYKLDFISSTTYQAMHYGLPVVCYQTAGTPILNKEKECVLIAEMGNVDALAEKMLVLLDDSLKAEELKDNAKRYVDNLNDGQRISDEIMSVLRAINDHYYNGVPIPNSLICNPMNYDKEKN